LTSLETGAGVLTLTDLFGGTPSNVAIAASADTNMEVVTGANLPLLLRALGKREQLSLHDLATTVAEYGRQQILTPNQLLEKSLQ
jgi:PTS system mannose-specific IIA component